jgi:hypothetical protein
MSAKSTVKCSSSKEFFDAIQELVYRGVVFHADATTLTIVLTGAC